jgi:hypothetical protein
LELASLFAILFGEVLVYCFVPLTYYAVTLLMFATYAVLFSVATRIVYITPAMFFSAIDCAEVIGPLAVTVPVTAVDTDAIGMVRSAGAPAFAILAITRSRRDSSCSVSTRELSVALLTGTED